MPPTLETAPKYAWLQHVTKGVAVIASTGAAIASIVTALHSNGVIGKGSSAASAANTAAAWVRLTPAVDTATAIGDTVAFAATAADQNGSILGGMTPVWTSGDSTIATVAANGTVIARGPGVTTIAVVVGKRVASAHVVVRQQVAGIAITTPAAAVREGDTLLVLPEGHQVALRARVHDARGHTVQGRSARWAVDDTTVAAVDLQGQLTAGIAGRGVVRATVDGMSALMPLAVVALPAAIGVVDGSGQRALAGRRLPREIVVRAITRRGAPAAGRLVTFRVAAAGGSAEPLTATTDADGRARTQWTLGERPGAQSLQATVEQVDSAAVVEAEADPLAGNARIAAVVPALRARAGATLQDSVAVRLTDSTGYPLAGVPVRWNAVHGSVQAVDLRTDSGGVARARWTLAPATGTQRLRALVGTPDGPIAPGEILATAVAGPAAAIAVVRGDRQQAGAGRALASPIVLRVVDAGGNGVPGVPVVLTLSGGAVADSTPTTDSLGFVRVRWVLGRVAGAGTLAARAAAVQPGVTASARATAGAAANLALEDAPAPKGGGAGARRLVAQVSDLHGNPVADAAVRFTVKSGTVSPGRAVTDARGRVKLRWVPGAAPGDQLLRATVPGTDATATYTVRPAVPPSVARRRRWPRTADRSLHLQCAVGSAASSRQFSVSC